MTWRPTDKLSLTAGANAINGGWWHQRFTLFDAPRNIGAPRYTETSHGYNKSQIYVVLRRAI